MGGATLVAVLALINEVLAVLPALVAAGVNLAKVVKSIEDVWASAEVEANDPRFDASEQAQNDARAALKARLEVLKAQAASQ